MIYHEHDTEVKLPIGGIGTGTISLDSRGHFCDYEIFNEPSKNRDLPYTFFSIYVEHADGTKQVRILEAQLQEPHRRPLGYFSSELAGLPRFNHAKMTVSYPFASIVLEDDSIGVHVEMVVFNPLIPLDDEHSGIPGMYIDYHVTNLTNETLIVSIAGSYANPVAFDGYDLFNNMQHAYDVTNEFVDIKGGHAIHYRAIDMPKHLRYYGDMCFATTDSFYTIKPVWLPGAWWDGIHEFWHDFSTDGDLNDTWEMPGEASEFNAIGKVKIGSLALKKTIDVHETKTFSFVLGWHFPNRPNQWEGHLLPTQAHKDKQTVKNHYAYRYDNAISIVEDLIVHRQSYEELTQSFTEAMYTSTIPKVVIDAVMSNITVLRSTTCFRIHETGTFLGWEGCFDHRGSCEGNCTHVYNYAQTIAYLFPKLEQDMRYTEFLHEQDEHGKMSFRTNYAFGDPKWDMVAATDGQLGCIIRLYRDWKLSGNRKLIEDLWEPIKKTIAYTLKTWDSDGDGVLDSKQHNTYDIEFYGPNSLTNSIFLVALKAAQRMAETLNDHKAYQAYRNLYKQNREQIDRLLWNGEYYIQQLDDVDQFKYQYGIGCLSDQIFGQTLAHLNGLGYILPEDHVKKAVHSIFKFNYRSDLSTHENVQRVYGLNQEGGLLICSWPHGGRPKFPFVYADEVWSGIEYQVATHLIYEGFVDEAIQIVTTLRNRYNGKNRNPFNEIECGNHYVRSMASFGLLVALSGYVFDLDQKVISFHPRIHEKQFRSFFINGSCWGIYERYIENGELKERIKTLYGDCQHVELKAFL